MKHTRVKMWIIVILFSVSVLIPFGGVLAAPGDLDPTFGNLGMITTDFGGQFDAANAVVSQPNGKIVAGGVSRIHPDFDDLAFALARYNQDGSLDPSFGVGGRVRTAPTLGASTLATLSLQEDGKIIAVGAGNKGLLIVRYDADGQPDLTFGSGGVVVGPLIPSNYNLPVAIQADGKIVVGGATRIETSDGMGFFLLRCNADGTLDLNFGTGGVVTTRFASDSSSFATALAIEPSGQIVLAGNTTQGSQFLFALARYDSSGRLDPTFGSSGKVTTVTAGSFNRLLAVAPQADGRILAAGTTTLGDLTYSAYLRYNINGALDPSFGTAGNLPADSLFDVIMNKMAILPNDRVICAGSTRTTPSDFIVAKYSSNGNFDTAFGSGGKTRIDFSSRNDACIDLALQGDSKLVLAGVTSDPVSNSTSDFALARLDLGPSFDMCVEDDSGGGQLKINTSTGAYEFTDCAGLTIDGVGTITRRGSVISLQHNALDRRLLVRVDATSMKATATIQLMSLGRNFTITDRNTANNTCTCR